MQIAGGFGMRTGGVFAMRTLGGLHANTHSRAALQYTGNPENECQRRHVLAALDLAPTRPLDAGQSVILTGNLLGALCILDAG